MATDLAETRAGRCHARLNLYELLPTGSEWLWKPLLRISHQEHAGQLALPVKIQLLSRAALGIYIAREVGLPDVRLHDPSHGVETALLDAEVDLEVGLDLLGQSLATIAPDIHAQVLQGTCLSHYCYTPSIHRCYPHFYSQYDGYKDEDCCYKRVSNNYST